jgi:hypothetical protein
VIDQLNESHARLVGKKDKEIGDLVGDKTKLEEAKTELEQEIAQVKTLSEEEIGRRRKYSTYNGSSESKKALSSKAFPFVSGTKKYMNNSPSTVITP